MDINEHLIKHLELLTRDGKTNQVKLIFQGIVFKKIPRIFIGTLANIARRNNFNLMALKILNPLIRQNIHSELPVNDRELLFYAAALADFGFSHEAREVILTVKNIDLPERNLQLAFVYFSLWNYQGAIPLLKKYINLQIDNPYRHAIGLVNLAAAYIASDKLNDAQTTLENLIQITTAESYNLLRSNTYELYSQFHIRTKNYQKGLEFAIKSQDILPDKNSLYHFFAQKWEGISRLLLNPSHHNISLVEKVKDKAKSIRHWETIRDCDLYMSYALTDEALFKKLIWGTPSPFFQKKAEKLWQKQIEMDPSIMISDGNLAGTTNTPEDPLILDLSKANPLVENLIKNKYSFKLLKLILSDFYRPKTLGEIFSALYSNQYYNPETSGKRVLNHFHFLQKVNGSIQSPLILEHYRLEFGWQLKSNSILIIPKPKLQSPSRSLQNSLSLQFKGKSFRSQDVSHKLNVSIRKAQYLLNTALEKNLISSSGKGPSRIYKLKAS